MWPRVSDRRLFVGAITGVVVLAWVSLWVWQRSPYGRFLSHQQNESVHALGGGYALLALVFVAGWTLMTVAMMLPTSLPLVAFFHTLLQKRADRLRLVVLLIMGYLSVWAAFAVVVHLADLGLHKLVERSGWLGGHAWLIAAATIAAAGVYQFSPLKYHCLDKCRSPLSFIMEHWQGRRDRAQAFRLGVHHGLFCLGCCWSLMLLMFAVGVGSLGWMLLLGAVMAAEKNLPWGRHLSTPLGATLIAWATVLATTGGSGFGGGQ
jgi:predicted metal-binding membrane protein